MAYTGNPALLSHKFVIESAATPKRATVIYAYNPTDAVYKWTRRTGYSASAIINVFENAPQRTGRSKLQLVSAETGHAHGIFRKRNPQIISKKRAVETAFNWHGGMSSPLYSFASTGGVVHNAKHFSELMLEVQSDLRWAAEKKRVGDFNELERLRRYLMDQRFGQRLSSWKGLRTGNPSGTLIARWESRGGKYWLEVREHTDGTFSYATENGGGHSFDAKGIGAAIRSQLSFMPSRMSRTESSELMRAIERTSNPRRRRDRR
jgi:hypothetical protein